MEYRDCTIYVVKTKVLISCTVAFDLAYAKHMFSHGMAQIIKCLNKQMNTRKMMLSLVDDFIACAANQLVPDSVSRSKDFLYEK